MNARAKRRIYRGNLGDGGGEQKRAGGERDGISRTREGEIVDKTRGEGEGKDESLRKDEGVACSPGLRGVRTRG